MDCGGYDTAIRNLRNVDIKEYCTHNTPDIGEVDNYSRLLTQCMSSKTKEVEDQLISYSTLTENCKKKNEITKKLIFSEEQNQQTKIELYETEISSLDKSINTLTESCTSVFNNNEDLQPSIVAENNRIGVIDSVSEMLNVPVADITKSSGEIDLTNSQKVQLRVIKSRNESKITKLNTQKGKQEALKN